MILRGKTYTSQNLSFEQQPLIDSCDGALIAPNPLRSWIAQGNMKHLPDGFLLISGSDRTTDLRQVISNIKNVALGISYATSQTGPITWLPKPFGGRRLSGWPLKHVNLRLIENSKNLNKNGKIFDHYQTPELHSIPEIIYTYRRVGDYILGDQVMFFSSIAS